MPHGLMWDLTSVDCMQVAVDEVKPGSRMQLLVRDPAVGRKALEADLQVCSNPAARCNHRWLCMYRNAMIPRPIPRLCLEEL